MEDATEPAKSRKWLGLALRVTFTLACLGYLAWSIPLKDFLDTLKGVRWPYLATALAILGLNQPLLAMRWKTLLDAQGLRMPFLQVLRLNLLGLFFNNTMPGQTGGDVVKAYAAAKRFPGRGTAAVVTVFLDRGVGMLGLVLLAGIVSTVSGKASGTILGLLGLLLAGAGFYFSPLKRRWLTPERIRRLPVGGGILAEVDEAVLLYRDRKMAVLLGVFWALCNHTGYILVGTFIGRALGIPPEQVSFPQFVVIIAIVSMIGCIPVSVMGFGIGEVAYVKAFAPLGVPQAQALALSLLTRFCLIAWGLLGGLVALLTRPKDEAQ